MLNKKLLLIIIIVVLLFIAGVVLIIVFASEPAETEIDDQRAKNIIFILADDLGLFISALESTIPSPLNWE